MYNGQTGNLNDDVTINIDAGNIAFGGILQLFSGTAGNNQRGIVMAGSNPDEAGGSIKLNQISDGGTNISLHGVSGNAEFSGCVNVAALHSSGGCDVAESFDARQADSAIPGQIMVLDSEVPGRLRLSTRAYDTKVAGIVSGAGGLQPGVTLGGGIVGSDSVAVALTGRVYCFVDATQHAVQVGDLLTTSGTPGHAMKVTDFARSQGAVLGKAMHPLAKGKRGLVLVLVALQ